MCAYSLSYPKRAGPSAYAGGRFGHLEGRAHIEMRTAYIIMICLFKDAARLEARIGEGVALIHNGASGDAGGLQQPHHFVVVDPLRPLGDMCI